MVAQNGFQIIKENVNVIDVLVTSNLYINWATFIIAVTTQFENLCTLINLEVSRTKPEGFKQCPALFNAAHFCV